MIDTGKLTDALLEALSTDGVEIGDGVRPAGVGWAAGYPNFKSFTPYSVVQLVGGAPDPALERIDCDFRITFSLRHHGATRVNVDYQARLLRPTVSQMKGTEFGLDDWFKVIGVTWDSLGPVDHNPTVDPPMWSIDDRFTLLCSRLTKQPEPSVA